MNKIQRGLTVTDGKNTLEIIKVSKDYVFVYCEETQTIDRATHDYFQYLLNSDIFEIVNDARWLNEILDSASEFGKTITPQPPT